MKNMLNDFVKSASLKILPIMLIAPFFAAAVFQLIMGNYNDTLVYRERAILALQNENVANVRIVDVDTMFLGLFYCRRNGIKPDGDVSYMIKADDKFTGVERSYRTCVSPDRVTVHQDNKKAKYYR